LSHDWRHRLTHLPFAGLSLSDCSPTTMNPEYGFRFKGCVEVEVVEQIRTRLTISGCMFEDLMVDLHCFAHTPQLREASGFEIHTNGVGWADEQGNARQFERFANAAIQTEEIGSVENGGCVVWRVS